MAMKIFLTIVILAMITVPLSIVLSGEESGWRKVLWIVCVSHLVLVLVLVVAALIGSVWFGDV